ncbi:MAG: peroxide stress protein YaaA [Dermatophilaceae bacterium]
MLILLPPSEGKTGRVRGARLDPASLSFPELTPVRAKVATALADVSAAGDAPSVLGVSANLVDEIARNTVLATAPTLPALECYSGVLYDALAYADLSPAARRRANRWLVVVSALYGAVRPKDRIAPYRLSMAVNLPGVGPLASVWKPHLAPLLTQAAGRGLVVDCRSSTYAAAWTPTGQLASRWVQVHVPGATHMAKHTRGLVAAAICELDREPGTPAALAAALAASGRFEVSLAEPARPGRPWTLSTTPA